MDDLRPLITEFYTLEELNLTLEAHGQPQRNACTDLTHHYWSRKTQFRAKIQAWHTKHHVEPLSKAAMADVLLVNDRLPRPPQPYRGGQKTLTALIAKERRQFLRELLCGSHTYANEFDCTCAETWRDKALVNVEKTTGRTAGYRANNAIACIPIVKTVGGQPLRHNVSSPA